jgi:hypothetical protein
VAQVRKPTILLRLYGLWTLDFFEALFGTTNKLVVDAVGAFMRWTKSVCSCGCGCRVPAPDDSAPPVDPAQQTAAAPAATATPPAAAISDEDIREAMQAELEEAFRARINLALGVTGIYAAWGCLAWFIFVYGRLVYDQLGMSAEDDFVRAWLVALGVDNAAQWKDVIIEALRGAAFLLLLDRLWLLSNTRWFEDYLDYATVQATLLTGSAISCGKRLSTHLSFYAYMEE